MRYFIDTHTFVNLYLGENDEFDKSIADILYDYENTFVISSESVREIKLLLDNKKIDVKEWRAYDDVKKSLDEHGVEIRYVDESHLRMFYKLEHAPKHTDPFDLMIIAQAITEKHPLISSDTEFPFYTKQGLYLKQNFRGRKRR